MSRRESSSEAPRASSLARMQPVMQGAGATLHSVQLLWAEVMPEAASRVLLACIQTLIVLGVAGAFLRPFSPQFLHSVEELQVSALTLPAARDCVQRLQKLPGDDIAHNGSVQAVTYTLAAHVVDMVALLCFFIALLAASTIWLHAMMRAQRQRRYWTARRRHLALEAAARAVVMLASVVVDVALAASELRRPERACSGDALSTVAAGVAHVATFVTSFLFVLDAHGRAPVKGRPGVVVKDLPYRHHWGKVLLLVVSIGASFARVVAIARVPVDLSGFPHRELISQTAYGWLFVKLDGTCSFQSRLLCLTPAAPAPAVLTLVVALLLYTWIGLYIFFFIYTAVRLRREIYQNYADPLLKVLLQSNLVAFLLMFLPLLLLEIVNLALERSSAVAYTCSQVLNDPVPAEGFVLTAVAVIGLLLTRPFTPADGRPTPEPAQQGFAWTQRSRDRKRARHHERLHNGPSSAPSATASAQEGREAKGGGATQAEGAGSAKPVFCMETALKALYWSSMLYNFEDSDEHKLQHLHPEMREQVSTVEEAMALFNLQHRQEFYNAKTETRIVMGWSAQQIVICARGSSARANFVHDGKMLQTQLDNTADPAGAVKARVHKGFHATWAADGIRDAVLEAVKDLTASSAGADAAAGPVQEQMARPGTHLEVLTCGHSLGGAVACLAAYDIVQQCGVEPGSISCYTFGCPRVGNRAFVAKYNGCVPDTWHVSYNNDIVVHSMAIGGLYRRCGKRAILTSTGSLIVAPTVLESSLLRTFKRKSVFDHFLTRYYAALRKVLTNQVGTRTRSAGGVEGLLQLLQSLPVARTALKEHAQQQGISLAEQLALETGPAALAAAEAINGETGNECASDAQVAVQLHSSEGTNSGAGVRSAAAPDASVPSGRQGQSGGAAPRRASVSQEWTAQERLAVLRELRLTDSPRPAGAATPTEE